MCSSSSEQHQLCGLEGANFGFHGFRTKVWIHKDKMLVSKTERLHTVGHRDSEKKYTAYSPEKPCLRTYNFTE